MTQTYEAWRITYQSSEQAARAAFDRMMELEQGKCLHQIAEPAAQAPDDAQIKALMRKHRIWIEHSTLLEGDEPERELRAVQAEEHQFNAFVQDLIAATQLAAAPQALQAATESVLIDGVAYEVHAEVAAELLRLHIELQQASSQSGEQEELRVCNNEECGWIGPLSETYGYKHSPATLCPECKETTELAAPAHPAEGVPAQAVQAEPSPTAGMNIAQRIQHVGGRDNAAGYIEFGSIQAVEALVRQVLRDMPAAPLYTHPTQQGLEQEYIKSQHQLAEMTARAEHAEAKAAEEQEHAAFYRWMRDQNDWYAEPRIDAADGTVWKLTMYSPQEIMAPDDDDSLDAAIRSALAAQAKQGGAYHG